VTYWVRPHGWNCLSLTERRPARDHLISISSMVQSSATDVNGPSVSRGFGPRPPPLCHACPVLCTLNVGEFSFGGVMGETSWTQRRCRWVTARLTPLWSRSWAKHVPSRESIGTLRERIRWPTLRARAAGQIEQQPAETAGPDQPAKPSWRLVAAGFRRPPVDPAARPARVGLACPPADSVEPLVPVGFRRPPVPPAARLVPGDPALRTSAGPAKARRSLAVGRYGAGDASR
jgi:hypothetical protein